MENLCSSIQTSVPLVSLDRLSSLPDDTIHIIFLLMPIRDVVRTSALSRIWRYKWMSIPRHYGRCRVEDALGGSVSAREVYLLKHFIEKLFICSTPERFCITFSHLSHISLEINFEDSKEILVPLFFFRSAPCLQKMTIKNCSKAQDYSNAPNSINSHLQAPLHENKVTIPKLETTEMLWFNRHLQAHLHVNKVVTPQNSIGKKLPFDEGDSLQAHLHENEVIIPKLETMEIFGFKGMDHEMRLIKFMLWHGVALERINVTWDISIFEEIDRRMVIVQDSLRFRRVWGTRVIFHKPA